MSDNESDSGNLRDLRERLTAIDRQILGLAAERQRVVGDIGRRKRAAGQPTRDFEREREVIELARSEAAGLGLSAGLAERLMRQLIRSSLVHQEQARVSATGHGAGRRALVIGGAGKMGLWFVEFLASQGFDVEVADPAGPVSGYAHRGDWREGVLNQALIVVATPLGVTRRVLHELAERRPPGLIFDVASLKTPIREPLRAAVAAGCRIASVHPMFGPDTELLSGRHVIFIDLGAPDAASEVQQLFAPTMVETVQMDLDEHDRIIAFVLGLSHALNIAFFDALAGSGEAVPRLMEISSTTFDAQLAVASRVATESPEVYYEIQALNDYGAQSLDALQDSLSRLRELIRNGAQRDFATMMARGKDYLTRARSSR